MLFGDMAIHLFDDYDLLRDNLVPEYYEKGSIWIGILVFFVLHYLLGWITNLLFGTEGLWIGPAATIHFGNETSVNITPGEGLRLKSSLQR